jgi:hypothetical protein
MNQKRKFIPHSSAFILFLEESVIDDSIPREDSLFEFG